MRRLDLRNNQIEIIEKLDHFSLLEELDLYEVCIEDVVYITCALFSHSFSLSLFSLIVKKYFKNETEKMKRRKKKEKKYQKIVRLQIPLFSEQDNFLLKRGLRIIF